MAGLVVAGSAVGLHAHRFLLRTVRVTGLRQLTAAQVRADLALAPDTFLWQTRPWTLAQRLRRDPLVAAASVRWLWPNGLAVTITERVPAVLVRQRSGAWEVDASGRLLRFLPGGSLPRTDALPRSVPVVSGMVLREPVAGRPSAAQGLPEVMRVALALGHAEPDIRSLEWSPRAGVVALTRDGIRVDFGDGSAAQRQSGILLGVLAVAASEGVRLADIDLSAPATPAVSLRPGSPPFSYNGVVGG